MQPSTGPAPSVPFFLKIVPLGLDGLGPDMTSGAKGAGKNILSVTAAHKNVHDACTSITWCWMTEYMVFPEVYAYKPYAHATDLEPYSRVRSPTW